MPSAPSQPVEQLMPDQPLSILFFDDDKVDRMRLNRYCRKIGLNFVGTDAGTLAQLANAIDLAHFDLIFLDYHVGADTGLEALAMVKANGNQIGAVPIMATSVSQHDIVIEAMRDGCADYLIKDEICEATIRRVALLAIERSLIAAAILHENEALVRLAKTLKKFSTRNAPELQELVNDILSRVQSIRADHPKAADTTRSLKKLTHEIRDLSLEMEQILVCLEATRNLTTHSGCHPATFRLN